MPMEPTPKEDQATFVSRCIEHEMKKGTTKDNRQAAAICYSYWRDRNKKKTG